MRSLGGPSSVPTTMIDRCLSRMAAWVRLAVTSIKAEFPSWELVMAFGAFSLHPLPSPEFQQEALHRMAGAFSLDLRRLSLEFADHQAFAARRWKENAADSQPAAFLAAWTTSVLRTRQRTDVRRRRPSCQLHALLMRYAAFCGASTSSVERNFAKMDHIFGKDRAAIACHHLVNELKLQLDLPAQEEAEVVGRARRTIYGLRCSASIACRGRSGHPAGSAHKQPRLPAIWSRLG